MISIKFKNDSIILSDCKLFRGHVSVYSGGWLDEPLCEIIDHFKHDVCSKNRGK